MNIKSILSSILISCILLGANSLTTLAADEAVTTIEDSQISPRKIDTSGTIALNSYGYFEKSFTMNGLLGIGSPHNAISIKISNISHGSCKVEITSSAGYKYTSSSITSSNTITVSNCKKDVTYTVSIIAGLNGCEGKYSITSFTK